jgi:hypothetical protein
MKRGYELCEGAGRLAVEEANHRHPQLLRMCASDLGRELQSGATRQFNELAPPHSITSSARASSAGGTSRPSALALLRLTINSNFVG